MNEVKRALVEALDESASELERLAGMSTVGNGVREDVERLLHDDFPAKAHLMVRVVAMRGAAKELRRTDWIGALRPERAGTVYATLEAIRQLVRDSSENELLRRSVDRVLGPVVDVIQKYAVETSEGWRFREEDCDIVTPFPDPPPAPSV
jgi:hypothetical protein